MLVRTQAPQRHYAPWFQQILASVAATLIASALYSVLPRLVAPAQPVPVALTSGGKFAARVPVPGEAPSASAAPAVSAAPSASVSPSSTASGGWLRGVALSPVPLGVAPEVFSPEPGAEAAAPAERAHRPTRPIVHTALRRAATVVPAAAGLGAVAVLEAPRAIRPGLDAAAAGPLDRALSTARSVVAETAAAGAALLSRVMP